MYFVTWVTGWAQLGLVAAAATLFAVGPVAIGQVANTPGSGTGQQTAPPVPDSKESEPDREPPSVWKPRYNPNDPFIPRHDQYTRRAFFVSGKVVLENGDPAPAETRIERICGGQVFVEGSVDSKGGFAIQLGGRGFSPAPNGGRLPDPAGGPGVSTMDQNDLVGCVLQASLPGMRSNTVALMGGRNPEDPNVGTLTLIRMAKVEGFTISATTLTAPKEARKHYERGIKELKAARFDKAILHLGRAVGEFPRYAVAWNSLGLAHEGSGDPVKAEESYKKSIEADSKYVSPYLQLANLAISRQDWAATVEYSAKAIRMNPIDLPMAYYLNAIGNLQTGELEQAEASAREAKKLDTAKRFARVDYFLALILAKRTKFREAAQRMRQYIDSQPAGMDPEILRQQLEQIESLAAAAGREAESQRAP